MNLAFRFLILLLLATAAGGCHDRRKDVVPTKIEKAPKEQPQPGAEQGRS
jgi:hypothetical protein